MSEFRTSLGEQIFKARYAATPDETWTQRAKTIVKAVCGRRDHSGLASNPLMSKEDLRDLEHLITKFIIIPGGRYIYYSGRGTSFYSNCYLFKAEEDSREEWGRLLKVHSDALMSGGGTGCDYSALRPKGSLIKRTGGVASGPLSLMNSMNEVGRNVRQGGSRRCLPEDTLVTMADYTKKPIAEIKIGDLVLTRFGARRVIKVFDQGEQEIYRITTERGFVRSTANHRWLAARADRSKKFIQTDKLNVGDKLYAYHTSSEIPSKILSIAKEKHLVQTYDIEVEEVHEFIADGFVSHNSAILASLNWQHGDIEEFLKIKDWAAKKVPGLDMTYAQAKAIHFDFPAPLDGTNITVNYDDEWVPLSYKNEVFLENVRQACMNGEPGFGFNFGALSNETLRNAPVSARTWVLTDKGYKQISQILSAPVTLWTGKNWAHNVQFECTKRLTPTVNVLMTGNRMITADPDHEFLVERWQLRGRNKRKLLSIDRVPASQLKPQDILHVSYPSNDPPQFDPTEYMAGFMFGDGCTRSQYSARVTFCTPEKREIAEWIIPQVPHLVKSVNWNTSKGYVDAYFEPDYFLAEKTDITSDMSLSFIAGLFDADGNHTPSTNDLRLSSIHLYVVEAVRRSLEAYGIMSYVSRGSMCSYSGNPSWTLSIAASYRNLFADLVPTYRLRPNENYQSYRESRVKVISVTEGPIEDVYCCNVGLDEHSFMAEGVIISNCGELTSEDDSDSCNLCSINMANCDDLETFKHAVHLASKFLICGTLRGELPNAKMQQVREKNRRLGLGLMGMHEWLLKRGYRYEFNQDLATWLEIYERGSVAAANEHADRFFISRPIGYRAIAPTGTISLLAGTSSGIEAIYAVAYKRRWIEKEQYRYKYVIDQTAKDVIEQLGIEDPDSIETAMDLAQDIERRVAFQASVQGFVDHAISSTINLPAWGTEFNNEETVKTTARIIARYSSRLRGITLYPDGARGGQPITRVPYKEAVGHENYTYEENDQCQSGVCGI